MIPGTEGTLGVGTEYEAAANRLWVAGGGSGQVHVFDASSGELLQTYTFSPAGFLNDLVVTDDAVYVTDSSFAWLDVIPIDSDGSLADPADAFMLPLGGDFSLGAGFNLNGIVDGPRLADRRPVEHRQALPDRSLDGRRDRDRARHRGRRDIRRRPRGPRPDALRRPEPAQPGRGVRAGAGAGLGDAPADAHSAALDVPTTIAWVAGATYVVNARFNTPPTPDTPYGITRLGT